MNIKGRLGALFIAPMLATLAGCLPQNAQNQGLHNTQMANDPCAPSATSSLVATGRSLLDIANSVLETQQSFNGSSTNYAQRVQAMENAQKLNQGHNVLNSVENLAGTANAPCVPAAAPASASR
ncbi:hypothetical protein ACRS3X_23435 [Ectopseudomonas hydrolytica]|uniref:hypothetical protein n=1 Tax=Ectopseudomonas hydrolytica TaxID=2493633 RepID=UPI003EE0B427